MTYRTLHILLLLLLLLLDVMMINVSGIGAFWLRCRTAVFDQPNPEVVNLAEDDTFLYGVANRARYRVGEDAWRSLDDPVGRTDMNGTRVLFDFGMPCVVNEVRWSAARGILASIEAKGAEGNVMVPEATLDQDGLTLRSFSDPIVSMSLAFDTGSIEQVPIVSGYNPARPAILTRPKTNVPEEPYWYLLGMWNAAALFGLLFVGAYRITRSLALLDDLWLVIKATGVAAVSVIVILFLYRGFQEVTYWGFEFSRLVVMFGAVFAVALLTANRAIIDAIHSAFLRRGFGIRRVVVVGAGRKGQEIVDRLRKHYWLAYNPVAFVDDNPATHGDVVQGLPVLGSTEALPDVARSVETNEVIVALPNSSHKSIRDIVGRCKSENLKFHILPDLFEVISGQVQMGAIDGVPILDLDDHYLGKWDRFLKRGLDITAVIVGGLLLAPVWVLIAAMIKSSSRGPVLFHQIRVGEHGKTFRCFKFRTMRVATKNEEASERKSAYVDLIQGNKKGGKIVNENRVTWVGAVLRRYRLDEMPQLLNVLTGEMSLVGPRPPIPYEVEHYNSWHMERLKGTPGCTGLWQVSGGPELTFDEMVTLDVFYLKNWSLWLDMKILLRTIPVLLSGTGA